MSEKAELTILVAAALLAVVISIILLLDWEDGGFRTRATCDFLTCIEGRK